MATIEVDTIELIRLILEGSNKNYENLPSENQNLTFKVLEEKLMHETGMACFPQAGKIQIMNICKPRI